VLFWRANSAARQIKPMKQIAIIGSGPSGCYLADQFVRVLPEASVDILERLPVPFGLVRYGVAPDHQGTKALSRVLDRILSHPRIAFFGNVEVGRDISLNQLAAMYDAVVLATGALRDRRLGVQGEELPGVLGSGAFVTWYNAHPEALAPALNGVSSAVIIGNGNVALDVARILVRDTTELAGSDLSHDVVQWLQAQPLKHVHIVGRRTASDAKFSEHELAEFGGLARAQPRVANLGDLQGDHPIIRILRGFHSAPHRACPVIITFHFSMTPICFRGTDSLEAVRFRRSAEDCDLAAQLAVTCIGYEANPCCTATPIDGVFAHKEGKITDRLYVVGWAKRGSSGTIPSNRTEAQQLAPRIAAEVSDSGLPGRGGLIDHLHRQQIKFVDYAGWKRIDAAESACATGERCRLKIRSISEMLDTASAPRALRTHPAHPTEP
jgi:hypothetical protein